MKLNSPPRFRSLFLWYGGRALVGLFALIGVLGFILFADVKHSKAYQTILDGIKGTVVSEVSPYRAKQERLQMRKDILLNQGGQRRIARIIAEEASLTYDQQEKSSEIVEDMNGVFCILQKKLFYRLEDGRDELESVDKNAVPMQSVYVLRASKASFHHKQSLFIGQDVELEEHQLAGHDCPDQKDLSPQPHLKAKAHKLTVVMRSGSNPEITAYGLRGNILFSSEGL